MCVRVCVQATALGLPSLPLPLNDVLNDTAKVKQVGRSVGRSVDTAHCERGRGGEGGREGEQAARVVGRGRRVRTAQTQGGQSAKLAPVAGVCELLTVPLLVSCRPRR